MALNVSRALRHTGSFKGLLDLRARGRRLSKQGCTWTTTPNAIDVESADRHLVFSVPRYAVEGDWVLNPELAIPRGPYNRNKFPTKQGLLLRQHGDSFAIIGGVRYQTPPGTLNTEYFRLMFEAEDLTVYLALDKLDPRVDELLGVNICQESGSSFAKLLPGTEERSRNMFWNAGTKRQTATKFKTQGRVGDRQATIARLKLLEESFEQDVQEYSF